MDLNIQEKILSNYLVSIVVPTYNNTKQDYVELFESINKQSFADESCLILINDGSTNGVLSTELIDQFLQTSYIYISYPDNKGVGYARQTGLNAVKSQYFLILDADDELEDSETIAQYIEYLETHPDCAAVCSWEKNIMAEQENRENDIVCKNFGMHGMFARETLRQHLSFKSIQYGEDGNFVTTLNMLGLKTHVLPFIGYRRKKGTLTYKVQSFFAALNDLNDLYNHIKYISTTQNTTNYPYFDQVKLTSICNLIAQLNCRLSLIDHHMRTHWHNHFPSVMEVYPDEFSPQVLWLIRLYYLVTIFSTMPKEMLYDIYAKEYAHQEDSHSDFTYKCMADVLLDKTQWYNPYTKQEMSYENLERAVKTLVADWESCMRAQMSKEESLPHQLLKNFPWNYKTYLWRS